MNKERRNQIQDEIIKLSTIRSNVERILEDEQYSFDSMPEGLQSSENGERSQEAIESMDGAIECIDNAIVDLEDSIS